MIRTYLMAVTALSVAFTVSADEDGEWALTGELAESCCCQPACPCVFMSNPTLGHCEGSSLLEIEKGHFGDVRVDGLQVVFSYRFGEWVRVYVPESASDEQMDAVVKLLNQDTTFGEFFAGDAKLLSAEKAEVAVRKSPTTIAFSVPDAKVRLEVMTGVEGKPIRIENLAIPYFVNGYTQYRATTTSYERDGTHFDYSGTNGATSHIDAGSAIEE